MLDRWPFADQSSPGATKEITVTLVWVAGGNSTHQSSQAACRRQHQKKKKKKKEKRKSSLYIFDSLLLKIKKQANSGKAASHRFCQRQS